MPNFKNFGSWASPDPSKLVSPKRRDLFAVQIGDSLGDLWFARSASKPKVSFAAGGSPLDNNAFFGEGFLYKDKPAISYDNISVKLLDPNNPNATRYFLDLLNKSFGTNTGYFGINTHRQNLGMIKIYQYGHKTEQLQASNLEILETWTLAQPQIVKVDFGDLDYSSTELLEITLEIEYIGFKAEVEKVYQDPQNLEAFKSLYDRINAIKTS